MVPRGPACTAVRLCKRRAESESGTFPRRSPELILSAASRVPAPSSQDKNVYWAWNLSAGRLPGDSEPCNAIKRVALSLRVLWERVVLKVVATLLQKTTLSSKHLQSTISQKGQEARDTNSTTSCVRLRQGKE